MSDPKRIDHFEIVRVLGSGGMGKVYLCRDTELDREVAVKVVCLDEVGNWPEKDERDAFSERLRREAKIAAALDHPGIVAIHQVGLAGDRHYFVMQFVDGQSLESLLRTKSFDRAETVRILTEVAAALDYAHGRGVVHRDVKPANIMLAQSRMVKLCDFGIAKSAMLPRNTSTVLMGTQFYMAPEQLLYQPADRRSDQWALGIVAYEMLAGRVPFDGKDFSNTALQIIRGPLPPLREMDPNVAAKVFQVLSKALAKEPAERFESCREFAEELNRVLGEAGPSRPAAGARQGVTRRSIPEIERKAINPGQRAAAGRPAAPASMPPAEGPKKEHPLAVAGAYIFLFLVDVLWGAFVIDWFHDHNWAVVIPLAAAVPTTWALVSSLPKKNRRIVVGFLIVIFSVVMILLNFVYESNNPHHTVSPSGVPFHLPKPRK